jgi:hypothetical protein
MDVIGDSAYRCNALAIGERGATDIDPTHEVDSQGQWRKKNTESEQAMLDPTIDRERRCNCRLL